MLENIQFGVPDKLLAVGESYYAEVEQAKAAAKSLRASAPAGGAAPRKRKRQTLRITDPWDAGGQA